jgi:CheY-like chemotaxis protein
MGTTIRVLFPTTQKPAQEIADRPQPVAELTGRGRILVVDDEEWVLELADEFLRRCGFDVLRALGGQQGIDIFREHSRTIDAVVLDLVMPDVDGERAFLELRRIREDVPVILATGYNEDLAATRFAARGLSEFIRKPYTPEDLVEKLRSVLKE